MGVAVGYTYSGWVLVRDHESDGPGWLLSVATARQAAADFEIMANLADPEASLMVVSEDGCGFTYTGTPALLREMAAQLREMASLAAPWAGEAGHA